MERVATLTRYRNFLRSLRDLINMVASNLENEVVLREHFDTIHYILDSMKIIEEQLENLGRKERS